MKNILLFVAFTLLITSFSFAQNCGTEATPAQIEYLSRNSEERANYSLHRSRTASVDFVPIQIHIVRKSDGTGGLTVEEMDGVIGTMNDYYVNANMEFFQCEDINYIDDDNYYDYTQDQENALGLQYDVSNVINIYFFNSITGSGGGGLCGYTYFAPSPDRIFMSNSCALNGSTMSHEMGHYFSLYHTHGKSNNGTTDELVSGANCNIAGDDLCDTPADPNLDAQVNNACNYTGTATDVQGAAYTPNPRNIMSYSRKECRDFFSTGQYNRIASALIFDREYLVCTSGRNCGSIASLSNNTMISNVTFNTISNTSFNCATYTNNTVTSTDVNIGETYLLKVTNEDCDAIVIKNSQIKVYIDWNGNNSFYDEGEEVFSSPYGAPSTFSGDIYIPPFATPGERKMRIICTEDSAYIDACGEYDYGETEEYTVNVMGSQCVGEIVNSYPYVQDFELFVLCSDDDGAKCDLSEGWQNLEADSVDWTLHWGPTGSSNTGPTKDYYPGIDNGKYMYIEASSTGNPEKTADVVSPCFDISTLSKPQLSFGYHMYGSSMGEMKVLITSDFGQNWDTIWSMSGDQGNQWNQAVVLIDTSHNGTIQFRWLGTTGTNAWSDMAIDNIVVGEECAGDSAQFSFEAIGLNLNLEDLTTNVLGRWWSFGSGISATSSSVTTAYTYPERGEYEVCLTTNSCGLATQTCEMITVDTIPDSTLGVSSLVKTDIQLYPNPTNGSAYLEITKGATFIKQYQVFNSLGEAIRINKVPANSRKIGIEILPTGMYLIRYELSDSSIGYRKLIVQ